MKAYSLEQIKTKLGMYNRNISLRSLSKSEITKIIEPQVNDKCEF